MYDESIIGSNIGHWTVLDYIGKSKHRKDLYLVRCSCGYEAKYDIAHIKKTKTKSCGCVNNPSLVGQVIGDLSVLSIITKIRKTRVNIYQCVCSCGQEVAVPHKQLISYKVTNCGCKRPERTWYEGTSFVPANVMSKLISGAEKRSKQISVLVTAKDIEEVLLKQDFKCALTGLDIAFNSVASLCTASIDRIDSNKDYEIGNIQIVHKDVNIMKNKYDNNYFISIAKLIATKFE